MREEPIKIDKDCCSECRFCESACPFEAISLDGGEVKIEVEKCQLCGICSSVCPSSVIELAYYDLKSLIEEVKSQKEILKTETLVVMCRGSSPPSNEIKVLKEQSIEKFIPLRLPCVGRVRIEFYLQVFLAGIKKIVVIQCDKNFCRSKKGSQISKSNFLIVKALLKAMGYEDVSMTIIENSQKAVYDSEKCVGCDKCKFICPYEAIEAQPLATPQVNFDQCKGCGACALVCPHSAIELQGFEYERLSSLIQDYSAVVEQLKAQGISPVILVFCCQWAVFSPLDQGRDGLLGKRAFLIELPCFSKLDPLHVLQAFNFGFDGVLAVVCLDEDCKSGEGRKAAEENVAALNLTLKRLGFGDRFEVYKTSPRYMEDFEAKLDSFLARISSLLELEVHHE